LLTAYIDAAMKRTAYKILEDGTYFGEIGGFQGVWANEATLEECRRILQEVLEEWLLLRQAGITAEEWESA
jgi:predicted RNase H-like HicB family nuclease